MHLEKTAQAQIYHLDGKIDTITAPLLEKAIMETISSENNKILLDFKDVTYISSAGVRMLIVLTKRINEFNGKLIIYNLNKAVWEIIKVTQLDHYLETADSDEEAKGLL